jgi:uncharacterized protein YjiS (DUF1127 family)
MSAHTADSQFTFKLPSLSYIDVRGEEPNLRAPAANVASARKGGLAAWLSRQIAGFVSRHRNRVAIAELATMSDHELMDIGLNRTDLHRVFLPEFNQDLRQRGANA